MLDKIRHLATIARYRLTLHARSEMDADGVSTGDLVEGIKATSSEIIEDYPEDPRGHSHLLLVRLDAAKPLHVCCAVYEDQLIIITVYRPNEALWTPDWRTRK